MSRWWAKGGGITILGGTRRSRKKNIQKQQACHQFGSRQGVDCAHCMTGYRMQQNILGGEREKIWTEPKGGTVSLHQNWHSTESRRRNSQQPKKSDGVYVTSWKGGKKNYKTMTVEGG